MPAAYLTNLTVEQIRSFYAEEIRIVANIESDALVQAFTVVPREQFLGPPPWRFNAGASLKQTVYRTTSDLRDLYHDVFVALRPDKFLNNGQPSLIARLIAELDLSAGKRALHIGCGSGYYSAIVAEVVGQTGSVTALEVDRDLGVQATANLIAYPQVEVVHQDATNYESGPVDAILVNAGVTHPHCSWLDSLAEGGVLILPLRVGKSVHSKDALVFKITRRADQFLAETVLLMTIYSSPSLCDPGQMALLNGSLESRSVLRIRSVLRREHTQTESCIVHTPGFCLSAEDIGVGTNK
jgi:protein-L-isoaspartate(D-aspartate) O-methyltransferase